MEQPPIPQAPLVQPTAPIVAPVAPIAPVEISAPAVERFEHGGETKGFFGNKMEIAQMVVLGFIAAAMAYNIFYQRRILLNPSLRIIQKDLNETNRKLKKVLGPQYEAA